MMEKRYLIVNADDFGQCPEVNRGIIAAYEEGIVTSASLMVRWPDAPEAAAYASKHPSLSLGLHLDLGEWSYRNDEWVSLYEVVPMDLVAVASEVGAQLERFRDLVGADPTHIDSHQHVHREEPVRSCVRELAKSLGVPLRDQSQEVLYSGRFYGQTYKGVPLHQAITVEALSGILASLPQGVTELGCHPGFGHSLNTSYRLEREVELSTLCDPRVTECIATEMITLCSFSDVPRLMRPLES